MQRFKATLLVGATDNLLERTTERLRHHGLKVKWHRLREGSQRHGIPVGTEVVVINYDFVGSSVSKCFQTLAREAKLPLIFVPQMWATAQRNLCTAGFKELAPAVLEEMERLDREEEEKEKARRDAIEMQPRHMRLPFQVTHVLGDPLPSAEEVLGPPEKPPFTMEQFIERVQSNITTMRRRVAVNTVVAEARALLPDRWLSKSTKNDNGVRLARRSSGIFTYQGRSFLLQLDLYRQACEAFGVTPLQSFPCHVRTVDEQEWLKALEVRRSLRARKEKSMPEVRPPEAKNTVQEPKADSRPATMTAPQRSPESDFKEAIRFLVDAAKAYGVSSISVNLSAKPAEVSWTRVTIVQETLQLG